MTEMRDMEQEVKEIHKQVYLLQSDVKEMASTARSAHHRLDEMKDLSKGVIEMGVSIKQLVGDLKELVLVVKENTNRIIILENRPAQNAYILWKQIFFNIICVAIGILSSKLI